MSYTTAHQEHVTKLVSNKHSKNIKKEPQLTLLKVQIKNVCGISPKELSLCLKKTRVAMLTIFLHKTR